MPVENRTSRFDDVDLTYNSATGVTQNVTLYATPFYSKTAVDVLALYAQDSIAWKRLTVTAGLRWEHLDGYLPEQSSPASRFFPALERSFPRVDDVVNWTTAGPALSAAYDLLGNGRTGLKGRRRPLLLRHRRRAAASSTASIRTATTRSSTRGTMSTATATSSLANRPASRSSPACCRKRSPSIRTTCGPYTDEFTGGVDHELFPALRLSVIDTHRVERNPQATSNPANPYDTFLTTRPDTGRDGVVGTADDSTFQFYNRTSTAVNQTFFTNDRSYRQTYNGIEITGTKRMSNRWQMLVGYTWSQSRVEGLSVNTNPNNLINVTGPLAGQNTNFNGQIGDRPHQFKLTGTYVLPWYDIGLAGNLNAQSGVVITRQITVAQTVGGNSTVNVEPLGSYRLPTRTAADLRVFKNDALRRAQPRGVGGLPQHHQPNTCWDARTLGGTINLRQNGDPNGAINTVPQFGSPAQVFGPRNIRFNAAFRF